MTVASLGLAIDSSGAVKGTVDLDRFSAAAAKAETAATKMGKGATTAAGSTTDLGKRVADAANVTGGMTGRINDAAKAHGGMSTQAMAAMHSIRGFTEQVAMGVPVTQALASHLNQLSYAATGPTGITGAFKEAGSILAGLLTPTRLVAAGVAATGVALYASYASWKNYALELDDVRRITGQTSDSMAALNSAAAFKGIDDRSFFGAMRKFSGDVYDAKIGLGGLADLLHANGKAAGDVGTTFGRVADLIKNARDDQQRVVLLQQAGLPTSRAWVDLMSQGAVGIADAKRQADAFGGAANDEMIQKAKEFDEAWNKAVRNIQIGFRGFFGYVLDEFDKVILKAREGAIAFDKATGGSGREIPNTVLSEAMKGNIILGANPQRLTQSTANDFYGAFGNRFTAPASKNEPLDPAKVRAALAAQAGYFGLLGQTLTVDQQIAQVENQIRTYRADPKAIAVSDADLANLRRLAKERALGIDQIKASKDAYNVEAATVGMSTEKAVAYAAVQNKINEYKRAGKPLTDEYIAQIQREADAMGHAAQVAEDRAFNNQTTRAFFQDTLSGLQQGKNLWDLFGNAAQNALNKIESKLLDKALDSVLGLGGGGGLLGGLFKSLGFAQGGLVPKYASGGYMTGPGTGTSDSILARVSAGEFVVNAEATRQNRALLEMINRGTVRRYAGGGLISRFAPGAEVGNEISIPVSLGRIEVGNHDCYSYCPC